MVWLMVVPFVVGCPADPDGAVREDSSDTGVVTLTSSPGASSNTTPGDDDDDDDTLSPAMTDEGPVATDDGSGTASDGSGTDDGPPPIPPIPENPTQCGNDTYECGDTLDNDGDGFYDLFDPECTGPCDDDESSFATGLPGDNMDCKQDCFFDGNSGQGDDGCNWSLTCDPQNPGANIGCEYSGGNNCNNQPPNQSPGCIEFCAPFVPPGCDCFGCCTVQTSEGSVDIFLNSGPDCSLENLEACQPCTSQIDDCGNPCEPRMCEICFGQSEPPPGCDMQMCDNGLPCTVNEDCPTDFFCLQGCCFPPPPG
jgi:hypothetical protein